MTTSPGSGVTECLNQTSTDLNQGDLNQGDLYIHIASKIFASVIGILAIVLGCYGNGTILGSVIQMCTTKAIRLERYMTNLALADLLVCIIVCPSYLYLLYSTDKSQEMCVAWTFSLVSLGTVSLGTLDMIAMHRQGRVIWKKSYGRWGSGRMMCLMVFLWVVGILLGTGALVQMLPSLKCHPSSPPNECLLATNRAILFLAPVYLASLALILVCYSKVAAAVIKQGCMKKAPKHSQEHEPQTSVAKLAHDEIPKELKDNEMPAKVKVVVEPAQDDNHSAQVSVEKEARALLMCVIVFLTVLTTWLPYIISCIIELWKGPQFILTQVKTCAGALVCLNSAFNPFIYSSLAVKRSGSSDGTNNGFDNSFGCLGWKRRQRNKMKGVVKADIPPKQLAAKEPDVHITNQASPEEDRRLVDVGVGPSGPLSQQVFSVYGLKKGVLISSATEYPAESVSQSNRRQSNSSLTFSRIRENSVNAEVSSICSPVKDSFTFMDFCRESSWSSHRSSRVTPCSDKTSARF